MGRSGYICEGGYPRHVEPRPAVAIYYVTVIGQSVAIAYCQECDDYHRPRLPEHNARYGNVERKEIAG